jgi:hypothetical protein
VLEDGAAWLGGWREVAERFLAHARPALEELAPSLDAFGAFIAQVVREADIPLVFARDTGPRSGHVSRTLSMHVLAFPEEAYLARFGGLELLGPFSDFESFGGYAVLERKSYRRFAEEGPGREVLEISYDLRDPDIPIMTARDWVAAESGTQAAGDNSIGTLARRAALRAPRSRTWSDAAEEALRARVAPSSPGSSPPGRRRR